MKPDKTQKVSYYRRLLKHELIWLYADKMNLPREEMIAAGCMTIMAGRTHEELRSQILEALECR